MPIHQLLKSSECVVSSKLGFGQLGYIKSECYYFGCAHFLVIFQGYFVPSKSKNMFSRCCITLYCALCCCSIESWLPSLWLFNPKHCSKIPTEYILYYNFESSLICLFWRMKFLYLQKEMNKKHRPLASFHIFVWSIVKSALYVLNSLFHGVTRVG